MSRSRAERAAIAVIGGGMVGGALAYGLAKRGADVLLLDEGDVAFRAARGNFGLVWTQGKGDGMPAYAAWSAESAAAWPAFAATMSDAAGRDLGYRRGGLVFCLGEEELASRGAQVRRQHKQGVAAPGSVLDRARHAARVPRTELGARVVGATFAPGDGHVNPLYLLKGLHAGFRRHGGRHGPGAPVTGIRPQAGGFALTRGDGTQIVAERIVIAAGVATPALAAQVGLDVPVRPQRGQIMVTERLRPLLPLAASALRQTEEGSVMIGVTNEEVGLDNGTTVTELARIATRAIAVLPALASARMARAWGCLRPLTPDGFPVYAQSERHPGAFVATCHSGVTLAPMHAESLAAAIHAGALPEAFAPYHPRRFHVRAAA